MKTIHDQKIIEVKTSDDHICQAAAKLKGLIYRNGKYYRDGKEQKLEGENRIWKDCAVYGCD